MLIRSPVRKYVLHRRGVLWECQLRESMFYVLWFDERRARWSVRRPMPRLQLCQWQLLVLTGNMGSRKQLNSPSTSMPGEDLADVRHSDRAERDRPVCY